MCERYPGHLFGTPVTGWDRGYNPLENQIQQQYRGRGPGLGPGLGPGARCWGSMSEGGGVAAAADCRTNLIVNYLPQTMTEKDLYAMFMTIGPIESCRVMKDFKTGYSYGFGFVNFTREEDALRAIDTFNGYRLRNKRLKVSYARPSGDDIKDTNLYVSNLPRAVTDEQLETIFGKYGRIVQKHILRDKNSGTPRGVAFVRFDKREEAQEAIAALNNVIPEGGTEPLSVKVAEEHGKQKAAFYAGWAAGFQHNRGIPVLPQRHHSLDQLDMLHTRDFSWSCGNCMVPEPWETFQNPPLGGSNPNTPRNGCRPGACANTRVYPNYPQKNTPRTPRQVRNLPWAPNFSEDRFKGQRCRNGTAPYW